ncbi:MAG: peptide deformylase [Clostridiales Family XIII bacterium]|jgi:peptide deformylase|nr:peptide deformylase [Clostridiales Family XIII bacterium]
MALRNIVTIGEDILRKKAKPVTDFGERTHILLDDMWDTMHEAEGIGLAAPQVGIIRRIVVIDANEPPKEDEAEKTKDELNALRFELLNPVIVEKDGEVSEREGCLSVPGKVGIVTRPAYVRVKAQDRDGTEFTFEGEGLLAKAVCHELDHLEGVLFTDIADSVEDIQ